MCSQSGYDKARRLDVSGICASAVPASSLKPMICRERIKDGHMKREGNKGSSLFSWFLKNRKIVPIEYEEELTLHFTRNELFDRHVILPHAEVNPLVYEAVNRFTERYGGSHMQLTIYSDAISETSQQFFREAFVSHYEDEYRRVTLYLYLWHLRLVLLASLCVIAYYVGAYLSAKIDEMSFLAIAITNIVIYCLWEIFNTNFKRRDTSKERKRIIRARDADIRFRS